MATILRNSFPVSMLQMDDEKGVIEAIVSVTSNKDRGGERVMPGFFKKSLERKMPRGVWCHDWTMPIAKTLVAEEWGAGDPRLPAQLRDLGGYYVKGQFNLETQRGREAYSDLKFGTIDEFSIGYLVEIETYNPSTKSRDLIEGEWFEWSPVLVGMNPATAMISIKGTEPEVKGQYFGTYIEASMTLGACYRVMDEFYWFLIDQLYDEDKSQDERLANVRGALDEMSGLVLKVIAGIMSGTGESLEMAMKTVESCSIKSEDFSVGLRAGLTLSKHSEMALAAVQGWFQRINNVNDLRIKEGRVLSNANRATLKSVAEQLGACAAAISELLDATDPDQEAKALAEAQQVFAKIMSSAADLAVIGG